MKKPIVSIQQKSVVTIVDDHTVWTVIPTYINDSEIGTQYTLINENPHRQSVGPYRTTVEGIERMFNVDVVEIFNRQDILDQ